MILRVGLALVCMLQVTAPMAEEAIRPVGGTVDVGPISAAKVSIHRVNRRGHAAELLAETRTDNLGRWNTVVPATDNTTVLLVHSEGGNYPDIASGATIAAGTLQGLLVPGANTASVSPVSSVLVRRWQYGLEQGADFDSWQQTRARLVAGLGFDPLQTSPAVAGRSSSPEPAAQRHAAVIGGISSFIASNNVLRDSLVSKQGESNILDGLINDLTDGVLDGVSADDKPVYPGGGRYPLPVLETTNRSLLQQAITRYAGSNKAIAITVEDASFDVWRPAFPTPDLTGAYSVGARWQVDTKGVSEVLGNRHAISSSYRRLSGALIPRPGQAPDCKRMRWALGPDYSDLRSIYHQLDCSITSRYEEAPGIGKGFTARFSGKQLVSHGMGLADAELELDVYFTLLSE
jgi:hypothetical protein